MNRQNACTRITSERLHQIRSFIFCCVCYQVPGYVNIYIETMYWGAFTQFARAMTIVFTCVCYQLMFLDLLHSNFYETSMVNCAQHIEKKPVNVYIYQRTMFIGIADAVFRLWYFASNSIVICHHNFNVFYMSPYNFKDNMAEDILHRVRSITTTYD